MHLTGETIMGALPHDCNDSGFSLAVAALLRRRYPLFTAKRVAADLSRDGSECTVKTAQNILAGHLSGKTITRLTRAYGLGLLIEAGAAVTGKNLETYILEQADLARHDRRKAEAREERFNEQLAALRAGSDRTEGMVGLDA